MLLEQGHFVGFHVNGHAGYAKHGEDIVCSAVSALTQTIVLGLTEHLHLEAGISVDEECGEMHCVLSQSCSKTECEQAEILFSTLYLGLCSIQESYSKYLKITQREV